MEGEDFHEEYYRFPVCLVIVIGLWLEMSRIE